MVTEYKGINRKENSDWLGWFILDLLEERSWESQENKNEIQIQLDYEVKLFNYNKKMEKPEQLMKEGFEALDKARECFEHAKIEYDKRSNFVKADPENSANVKSALHYLAAAYDEVSAIFENDI